MESWRKVWRDGIEPILSDAALQALRKGLESNDPRLLQGVTTQPPPLQSVQDWPVEAACALGYCGWQGEHLERVGQVEEYFAAKCFEIDQRLGEPAGCRFFLNWFDEELRADMIRELLSEVKLALRNRHLEQDTTA